MIGDQYLQTRAQLGTALFSLSTLAHGLHAGRDMLQTLQDLRSDLREPFLIMVAGEEKSGKSSLINALFGREIVPIAEPPARDKIHVYKYGVEAQEVPAYDQFIEHFLPDTLLRDFNIVDTPASSTITHQQLAVVDQLLPEADLVLFVYSITNPWSASSREFLSHISAHQPRNAMFVLQQCDLRDALEVEAVVAHLQQIIGERFPDGNRVFPVSAKKAFLAKTDAADKEGLFQQSYFGPLESYIDDTAFNSGPRADTLRTGCQSAQIILGMLAEKTRNAHAAIRRDIGILTELNAELEERRAQAVRLAGGVQWAVAQSYDRVQKLGEEILQQKAKTAAKGGIDEKMEESMTGQIRHAMELLEADMLQTWPQFHEIVLKRFPPGNMAEQPGDLISERAQLLLQIDTAVAGKKSPEYFGRQAPQWFADFAEWLQIPPQSIDAEGLRAAAPVLAKMAVADFHHAHEAAMAVKGRFSALGKTAMILAQFRAEMGFKREELLSKLEKHLRWAVELFHKEVQDSSHALQNFCSRQLMIYEPRMALAKQMEETLRKTGLTLGIQSSPPPWPMAK